METTKRIKLVFDNESEMEFMKANLIESGFEISKPTVSELWDREVKTQPGDILGNTLKTEFVLERF